MINNIKCIVKCITLWKIEGRAKQLDVNYSSSGSSIEMRDDNVEYCVFKRNRIIYSNNVSCVGECVYGCVRACVYVSVQTCKTFTCTFYFKYLLSKSYAFFGGVFTTLSVPRPNFEFLIRRDINIP